MDASARLVLCMCVLLFVTQVRSSYIPSKMNRTINTILLQHYVKKVFVGGILETYNRLLNKVLEQLPTPGPKVDSSDTIRNDLKYILKMVQDLRDNHFKEQAKLVDELQSLHNIPTDNKVIQSKALGELPWLYEEASSMANHGRKTRRRRFSQTNATKKL
uniref:Interferon gamma n=1 Tax=Knipowitschia caucasica TaxID=637954 RepID=A0AAV2ISY6_KNICA